MPFSFWQKWLFSAGIVMSIFGILMALLSGTPLFEVFNHQIDPVFWNTTLVDANAKGFQHWMYGVWGATIAGWGIFLSFTAHYPFRKKEQWAWNCITTGLLVWYLLDTFLSIYYQVYFNAVFNTVLLALVALPVIAVRKHFAVS
jgi:hypothetical protein